MDIGPAYLSVDPYANIIYGTNSRSDTVTKVDGITNTIIYGVRFDVSNDPMDYPILFGLIKVPVTPSNSINIECNGKSISDNDYVQYNNGTRIKCSAQSKNSPLISSSWSRSANEDSSNEFTISQYETLTGTFIDLGGLLQALSPAISVVVLIAVVFAASLPSFSPEIRRVLGTAKGKNQQRLFPLIADRGKVETTTISKGEIIALDGTVIAGILVFLTVSEGFEISEQTEITLITANIVVPFAISVVVAVRNYDKFAIRLMIAGFINLMICVILIAIMRL